LALAQKFCTKNLCINVDEIDTREAIACFSNQQNSNVWKRIISVRSVFFSSTPPFAVKSLPRERTEKDRDRLETKFLLSPKRIYIITSAIHYLGLLQPKF